MNTLQLAAALIDAGKAATPEYELVQEYLSLGGLFNPEMMDHEKVRDMVIELRDANVALSRQSDQIAAALVKAVKIIEKVCEEKSMAHWHDKHMGRAFLAELGKEMT